MEKILYPNNSKRDSMLARPLKESAELQLLCKQVFDNVRVQGDEALRSYTAQFDKVDIAQFKVQHSEYDYAETQVNDELKAAIALAYDNIRAFHQTQIPQVCEWENGYGVRCWQEARAIEKVGFYIPGGSAPLFSTILMLAIPAKLAGCEEIVICSPPDRNGNINPAMLWAARYCGVTDFYKIGGVQAIAAMALGSESINKVYKIFGPGNQYVTAAKQYATNYGVAIDMPAGPSEVMIIADETAKPEFVAADLLSQAEHGGDSQVILLTWTPVILPEIEKQLQKQLLALPRKNIAIEALANSKFIVLNNADMAIDWANYYAPEHLIICTNNYQAIAEKITNAGSVFLGNFSPESAGDYASGTNHTLPTNGFAKAYSGVNIDSFIKKITFQELSRQGLGRLASTIMLMADTEQLYAHKNAVQIRIKTTEE